MYNECVTLQLHGASEVVRTDYLFSVVVNDMCTCLSRFCVHVHVPIHVYNYMYMHAACSCRLKNHDKN